MDSSMRRTLLGVPPSENYAYAKNSDLAAVSHSSHVTGQTLGDTPAISELGVGRELKTYFGYEEFRPLQREIVELVLEGRDVLGVLPVGGGKQLCFELPALMHINDGITPVICPTISLINDRVRALKKFGIDVAVFHSNQSEAEIRRNEDLISSRKTALVYVSPERLRREDFYRLIDSAGRKVWRLVVDEAHCVSQWGHDFRPSYLAISAARRRLGMPPMAAFTATASEVTRADIKAVLGIEGAVEVIGPAVPTNIRFEKDIFQNETERQAQVLALIARIHNEGKRWIAYSLTIKNCLELHSLLQNAGIISSVYHGELEPAARERSQQAFSNGTIIGMCATKSFGMGIDLPVDHIIMTQLPESAESLLQAAGRAGRSQQPAVCTVYGRSSDISILQAFVRGSNPQLGTIDYTARALARWVSKGSQCDLMNDSGFPFPEKAFLLWIARNNERLEGLFGSALAALEEHKIIDRFDGKVRFLVNRDRLNADGLVSQEILDQKRRIDEVRMSTIVSMVFSDSPLSSTLESYFDRNEQPPPLEPEEIDDLLRFKIPEDRLTVYLGLLGLNDISSLTFAERAHTGGSAPKNEFSGRLGTMCDSTEGYQSGRARINEEIKELIRANLISAYPAQGKSIYALSMEGMMEAERLGVLAPKSEDWSDLVQRFFNPVNFQLVIDCLGGWIASNKPASDLNVNDEDFVDLFLRTKFKFPGSESTKTGKSIFCDVTKRKPSELKTVTKAEVIGFLRIFFPELPVAR
jgi:ATP-dependent DNA helicase RecQ